MINEWSDRLGTSEADDLWERQTQAEIARRFEHAERGMKHALNGEGDASSQGFYEAMRTFLKVRSKLFPAFPADPVWSILVSLATTPECCGKSNVTGIANGAEIPTTTVLRYLAAMEVEGIIERVPHPDDRRQTLIRLTTEGRRRLDAIADTWKMKTLVAIAVPAAALLALYNGFAA